MADIKKLNEALKIEILVKLYENLPSSVPEEQLQVDVEAVWKDPSDDPKWFVVRKRIMNFPPHMEVHACKDFTGRIDTNCVEMDAVLTAAFRDALYLEKIVMVG